MLVEWRKSGMCDDGGGYDRFSVSNLTDVLEECDCERTHSWTDVTMVSVTDILIDNKSSCLALPVISSTAPFHPFLV
jgi:hypothetical protein